ncbi:hypothetical protein K0819_12785 [Vibrio parahaemolyticus]|uniref:hypothetical protein n=1 Tax=Vibrio parahaemolyticus TaxID=670 RepID=UPI00234B9FD7|nr:hypothetical protein [Vibrio parahaemolyticus]WCM64907.1 hypothetical protein K0819_12785 [Vibrio parahaemolyticus]
MSKLVCDTEEYYYRTFILNNDTNVRELAESFIRELSEHSQSLNCKIENDTKFVSSFELGDVDDLEMRLEDIGDLSKVKLEFKCEKKNDRSLRVISPSEFINSISELNLDSQLKFWLETLREKYDSIIIDGENVSIDGYRENLISTFVKRHRKDSIPNLVGVRMNVCFFDFLIENLEKFSDFFYHLLEMRTILCLCLISRKCDFENRCFDFEGGHQIDLNNNDCKFSIERGESVYKVFQWVYNDEKLSARIGVINQVISQSRDAIQVFDSNLIKILDSIYQIYIKEDFEQYIEVRNRTSDATLDLCNRINEAVSNSRSTIKQSVFIILSYFFSIIVFTAIDKGKVENILTLELTVLSTLFVFSAFLSIWFSQNEMNKNIEIYSCQLDELKVRNKIFLSENEIKDFFSSESLTKSLNLTKEKGYIIASYSILILLLVCLWYFHLAKNTLVHIPVFLHIV